MVKTKTDEPTAFNNLVVGAFITSWARLELLKYLRKAGPMTVYYDTDSIIYVYDPKLGDPIPSMNTPVLGELKDEYPNRQLTNFCSTGSKSYGLKDSNGWQDVKFKGIQGGVSYDMLREMLCGATDEKYTDTEAVTKIRQILCEDPSLHDHLKVSDKGLQRCINKHVDGGFIKQRDAEKMIKVNFTNRRLVNPAELGLPDVIKVSSVPWGFKT